MKDVAKNVIERINRDIGSDIKHLYKCKEISGEYAKRVGEIEAEVNFDELKFDCCSMCTMNEYFVVFL